MPDQSPNFPHLEDHSQSLVHERDIEEKEEE